MTHVQLLSGRGHRLVAEPSSVRKLAFRASTNPYHPKKNPQGIINLGTAENSLCADLIQAKMKTQLTFEAQDQFYPALSDVQTARKKIADFFQEFMKPATTIDPTKVSIFSGAGAILCSLANVLASPGEYFLTPTPMYNQLQSDFLDHAGVNTCFLQLMDKDDGEVTFSLTARKVERALVEAQQQGRVVRAFVLTNPCNPLGDVYPEKLIRDILNICEKHNVHVIMDEVYALSVFQEGAEFRSVLSLEKLPNPDRTHFVWSASKDLGLSGARLGVLYTHNSHVTAAMTALNFYHSTPSVVVKAVVNVLTDTAWLRETYLPTNKQRMRESHSFLENGLKDLGVRIRTSTAGFFIWADFSQVLGEKNREAETKLLQGLLQEAGVYVVSGSHLRCEAPGWFRVVFTHPLPLLQTALERMKAYLTKNSTPKKTSDGGTCETTDSNSPNTHQA